MAAPARKSAPAAASAAKKPASGKDERAAGDKDGAKDAATPAKSSRMRLALFGVMGGMVLTTLGVGVWFAFLAPTPPAEPIPPPPALKPIPPTVVREGDLGDELWRRLGVQPGRD